MNQPQPTYILGERIYSQIKQFHIYFQIKQFHYFHFLCLLLKGVPSSRKEFAPVGANSFLKEWNPFEELHPPEKETSIHVVPLCNTDSKIEVRESV